LTIDWDFTGDFHRIKMDRLVVEVTGNHWEKPTNKGPRKLVEHGRPPTKNGEKMVVNNG
jgi:hypothetical protein